MGLLPRKTDSLVDLRKEIAAIRVQLLEKMEERISLLEEALAKLKEDVRLVLENISAPQRTLAQVQVVLEKAQILDKTIEDMKAASAEVHGILGRLQETNEIMTSMRTAMDREYQKLKAEREGLAKLRSEAGRWRSELEQKEAQISEAQETLKNLLRKKEILEEEIRVLTERYLSSFEDALKKLENFGREMDKMFKLREIRMERMVRREKELEERLALLENSKAEAEKLIETSNTLREEVKKLEAYKESLSREISDMERRRSELNELLTEMRRAFLTS